ncbi:hypothetical protein ACFE04_000393 [Oxalis oulophora]
MADGTRIYGIKSFLTRTLNNLEKKSKLIKRLGISPGSKVLLNGPHRCSKAILAKVVTHDAEAIFFPYGSANMPPKRPYNSPAQFTLECRAITCIEAQLRKEREKEVKRLKVLKITKKIEQK